jgi:hypothetical protein
MLIYQTTRTNGKHRHAVTHGHNGGLTSVCPTGPNAIRREEAFDGSREDVTCPECLKRLDSKCCDWCGLYVHLHSLEELDACDLRQLEWDRGRA